MMDWSARFGTGLLEQISFEVWNMSLVFLIFSALLHNGWSWLILVHTAATDTTDISWKENVGEYNWHCTWREWLWLHHPSSFLYGHHWYSYYILRHHHFASLYMAIQKRTVKSEAWCKRKYFKAQFAKQNNKTRNFSHVRTVIRKQSIFSIYKDE